MKSTRGLVLAAVLSLMLVFAFLIGITPSKMLGIDAGDDSISMEEIINEFLGKSAASTVTVSSPLAGATVKLAGVDSIAVPVNADVAPSTGNEYVTFLANGEVAADDVVAPWDAAVAAGEAVNITAMLNPAEVDAKMVSAIQSDAVSVNIVPSDAADADVNGIADDLLNAVAPNEVLVSQVDIDGATRVVLVSNLDGVNTVVTPDGGIAVTAPSADALAAAGFLADGESAILVVEVADGLAALLDEGAAAWADAAAAVAPGDALAAYVNVSILVAGADGVTTIKDLGDSLLAVDIALTDVAADTAASVMVCDADLAEGPDGWVMVAGVDAPAWSAAAATVAGDDGLVASVQQLGVLAAYADASAVVVADDDAAAGGAGGAGDVDGAAALADADGVGGAEAGLGTDPTITAISPNEAWIFGGVVAQITGTNLAADTEITISGIPVQGFRATGTTIDVIVPAYIPGDTTSDTVAVDVTVAPAASAVTGTLAGGFTYKRRAVLDAANEIVATAFVAGTNTKSISVSIDGSESNTGTLTIPDSVTDTFYGLAQVAPTYLNNSPNTPGMDALGTNIDVDPNSTDDEAIPGLLDMSLHAYVPLNWTSNTPLMGAMTYDQDDTILNFVDVNGDPIAGTPLLWQFPVTGTDFTYADVKAGTTVWGTGSTLDYTDMSLATNTQDFQSSLLGNEVNPAVTAATVDTETPNLVDDARLYSLNGFTLRRSAVLPDGDAADAATDLPADSELACSGGMQVTITSPAGGLAWVDLVQFVDDANNTVDLTIDAVARQASQGDDADFVLVVTVPNLCDLSGIVDILVFTAADSVNPVVTLPDAFQVGAAAQDQSFLLLLLGALVSLLGLAAGGESGGGDGGPCFIATAAYGTPLAGEVDTLRGVRDTFLLNNAVGSAFVDTYYRISPAIADVVAQSPVLAALVRIALLPVIIIGKLALAAPMLTGLMMMVMGALYTLRRRVRKA